MGAKTAIAEELVKGATFGLSNLFGITGREGLIHDTDDDPEKQAILVDDDGLYFIENKIQIGWDDVTEIVNDASDGNIIWRFELRGGLIVFSGWVHGDVDDYLEFPSCTDTLLGDLDPKDSSTENCDALQSAIVNFYWAIDIASKIRGSAHLTINETWLLAQIVDAYENIWRFMMCNFDEKTNATKPRVRSALNGADGDRMEALLRDQVGNLDLDEDDVDENTKETVGKAFFWSCGWCAVQTGDGIDRQKEVYDALRSARSWGYEIDDGATNILTSDEDEDCPFGAGVWTNYRKMIVCTDAQSSLSTINGGVKVANVMVMDAQDIIAYNDAVDEDLKLSFESNHPQNGVAYVQHPTMRNTYISIEAYHMTLLERKYEELKHILTCLGARSLELSAESSSSRDETRNARRKFSADVSADMVGELSAGFSNSERSAKMMALCKTLSTKRILIPQGKPYIPDDVEFYPTEQGWQRLAKLVLEGKIKSEEVALTYRNESAISGKTLRSISAKLHSTIPQYSFGAGADFESEYENELKSLESLTWNYKVEFGEIKCKEADASSHHADRSEENVESDDRMDNTENKERLDVESVILGRAKRYAKSKIAQESGMLSEAQRQDLEKLSARYGVDDLALEKIIDMAFS